MFAFGASTIIARSGGADFAFGAMAAPLVLNAGAARSFASFNFVPGADRITLQGFSSNAVSDTISIQVNGTGNLMPTLSDHTVINLVGVARADASFFG